MIKDRYTGLTVEAPDLPPNMVLGRFYYETPDSVPEDLTNANWKDGRSIRQELLNEEYVYIQDVFRDLRTREARSDEDKFEVPPVIRPLREKLALNEFELALRDKLFHLEEIFRNPHTLLTRIQEKVPVGRAKRITARSYRHLAGHTEDWQHKSLVAFKPSRIIHEDLDVSLDNFENQFTVYFVELCLGHFKGRQKEIQGWNNYFTCLEKSLDPEVLKKSSWQKRNRITSLAGENYEEEKERRLDTLSESDKQIKIITARLSRLKSNKMFQEVSRRIKPSFHDTNVFTSHKHYRYVKQLWGLYREMKGQEESLEQKKEREQDIVEGLRSYARVLIAYVLRQYLKFELKGTYSRFLASHPKFEDVIFENRKDGLSLKFCSKLEGPNIEVKFVVLGSRPDDGPKDDEKTCVLYWQDNLAGMELEPDRIAISPMDPDAGERLGKRIRTYLIRRFLRNLDRSFPIVASQEDIEWLNQKWPGYMEFKTQGSPKTVQFKKFPVNAFEGDRPVLAGLNKILEDYRKEYLFCPFCGGELARPHKDEPFWNINPNLSFICSDHPCPQFIRKQNANPLFKFKDQPKDPLQDQHEDQHEDPPDEARFLGMDALE